LIFILKSANPKKEVLKMKMHVFTFSSFGFRNLKGYSGPVHSINIPKIEFNSLPHGKLVMENNVWVYVQTYLKKYLSKYPHQGKYYKMPWWYYPNHIAIEAESLENALEIFLDYISYGYLPQKPECVCYVTYINKDLRGQRQDPCQKKLIELDDPKTVPVSRNYLNFGNWPIKIEAVSVYEVCPLLNEDQKKKGIMACIEPEDKELDMTEFCVLGCHESREFWSSQELPDECTYKEKVINEKEVSVFGQSFRLFDHTNQQ